ncbi:uncharacterized protein TRIVIDRAFT_217419 [Trichoderma virens Gv29-8]|uniref:N-acetyltransferase domain-containing protein n=1 Tax=Hypocrea virens (strain Gv29-8 / FGSC 10586) TaxID=413071 RepID=G9MED2_HYPVG|nr:uncharacterized protein TRIVIDRAFT_217419 [Trichoderma virens Gv29-8]EHK26809.1 hypothetical protein TRIVIDRAFT_217419 [Trichoderma virens Gv29-8]UKZ57263.1 hypothetical protein TrVGV298_011116 [Trichoderma virens]
MAGHAVSFSSVPEKLVELLTLDLPYSLPLLRRLQSTKFNHGTSAHARIVFVSDTALSPQEQLDQNQFKTYSAAYLDFSKEETQMYIYSNLEHQRNRDDASNRHLYELQLAEMVDEVVRLRNEYKQELLFTDPDRILIGSLHSDVRSILEKFEGRVESRPSGLYDKWLMRREELPLLDETLPSGMYWDSATLDDCRLVVSRTDIPRTAQTLVNLPNLMVKRKDKTPIAWALLGTDGSLISVHVEEPYRRQGLAKKLATKLLREKSSQFGDDGWLCADVSPSNVSSRAMCKSLNGKPDWVVSWICLILSETGVTEKA